MKYSPDAHNLEFAAQLAQVHEVEAQSINYAARLLSRTVDGMDKLNRETPERDVNLVDFYLSIASRGFPAAEVLPPAIRRHVPAYRPTGGSRWIAGLTDTAFA